MSSNSSKFEFKVLDVPDIIEVIRSMEADGFSGPSMNITVGKRYCGNLPDDLKRFFCLMQKIQSSINLAKSFSLDEVLRNSPILENVQTDMEGALKYLRESIGRYKDDIEAQEKGLAALSGLFVEEIRLFFKIGEEKEIILTSDWRVFS
jgi:hypothetical protein